MTPKELAMIKARAEAATDGPWIAEYSGETGNCVLPADAESTREYVARTQLLAAQPDAEFIAHARTDVPALLAEVERLTAQRDRIRETLTDARNTPGRLAAAIGRIAAVVDDGEPTC